MGRTPVLSGTNPEGALAAQLRHLISSLRRRVRSLVSRSISNLERRAVLRPGAAVIVDARGGDIGVAKPLLHLGDVGLVVERVGGGGRPQGVRPDFKSELRGVGAHQPVNSVRRDRAFKPAGAVVADWPEQRAALVEAMADGVEVIVDQSVGPRMQRQVARLAAFAGHFEMRHAFARVPKIPDLELAQLLAPQRVNNRVDRMARSRLLLIVSSCGASRSLRAW